MARVKRGTTANKRRKNVLKLTKGFRWGRKSKFRAAKEAMLHAGQHAYRGRKQKKRDYRALWITRLSAAAKKQGTSYNKMFAEITKQSIKLNRKVLSELALNHPKVFEKIVKAK
ncbi:MAG: 50S ribosomal protein L20 [Candidatus Doudnabacteria bacterium CG10_big_fil_rev_8_21_14_0_10_41_10]|uniref:Large ribosomal subunit protein bL20 n=1 Tax=Candidatus Doudnabacteria bacterium CG10_big_fil_rev_8_21_14_0_10_41_10 TaxID=1974551 RepID=A0A2H0VEY7_9BACT|nr:MAG: 50S ribosomal protein L20 [Candidatus Doudnabacteria bacterium CG10_big_fil_rev_8_21_14_0_10_41_10]